MIRFYHFNGDGQIQFIVDNEVELRVERDEALLLVIKQELDKGIPILKQFKQKGIPGKIMGRKKLIV